MFVDLHRKHQKSKKRRFFKLEQFFDFYRCLSKCLSECLSSVCHGIGNRVINNFIGNSLYIGNLLTVYRQFCAFIGKSNFCR